MSAKSANFKNTNCYAIRSSQVCFEKNNFIVVCIKIKCFVFHLFCRMVDRNYMLSLSKTIQRYKKKKTHTKKHLVVKQ